MTGHRTRRAVNTAFAAALAVSLALISVAATATPASAAAPKIVSFSPKSGQPSTLITINGTFNPSAKHAVIFSDGQRYSVTVPAVSASASAVLVSLPPYFTAAGAWAARTVSIRVKETLGASQLTSNTLRNLSILAPPRSSLPAGSYTLALLQGILLTDINLQPTLTGTSIGTPAVQKALADRITALKALIPKVQAVVSNSNASFVIATKNGANVVVNAAALSRADQMMLSLLTVLARTPPTLNTSSDEIDDAIDRAVNPVQAAAQAALNATTLPALNNAIADLVIAFEKHAKQNPKQVVYAVLLGAAVVAIGAAIVIHGAPAVLLAAQLQVFIGVGQLTSQVGLLSLTSLVYAAPKIMQYGCNALVGKGTEAGVIDAVEGFVTDVLSRLVLGGAYINTVKDVFDAIETVKCTYALLETPTSGIYNASCKFIEGPYTCCSGGKCTTTPPATFHNEITDIPIQSNKLTEFCPDIVSELRKFGCSSATCDIHATAMTSFSLFGTCLMPKTARCTSQFNIGSCQFRFQHPPP